MSWERTRFETAWAVFLYEGCDEVPEPDAVFPSKEDAERWIEAKRLEAMIDDYDGVAAAAEADGREPSSYLTSAGVQEVRNAWVPWWNSTDDVPAEEPVPVDEDELSTLVRQNAPLAGEDTLSALERRLAEWHRARYGDRPVDVPRTFAKLCEELGELARDLNRPDHRMAAIESADMAIVLFHLVRGLGFDLSKALAAKIPVIEARLTDQTAGRTA